MGTFFLDVHRVLIYKKDTKIYYLEKGSEGLCNNIT